MKKVLYVFILLFWGGRVSAQSPVFHCLLFLDTDDIRLSSSVRLTEARITDLAGKMAKNAEMKCKVTVVKGADLSVASAGKAIDLLQADEKDVIFFYFAGHGWNNLQSEYPMLKMGSGETTEENALGLETIYRRLLEKKARMTLAFAEACNGTKNLKQKVTRDGEADHLIYNMNPNKVRELFRQSKVNLIMTSSRRGQASYSNNFGGHFTNAFCDAFERMTSREYLEAVSWEKVVAEITEETWTLSKGAQDVIAEIEYNESNNARVDKQGPCAMNLVAFHKISEDYQFLERYWQNLQRYDKDKAVEVYEAFFQAEVPEFYENLVAKLNLSNGLPDKDKQWFAETAGETVSFLKQINRYKNDGNYRDKAFAKMSIPVDNLKQMYEKLDDLRKRCKE